MLLRLKQQQQCPYIIQQHHVLECDMYELRFGEVVMWRQRSRAVWLAQGDKNTNFFHGKASQ